MTMMCTKHQEGRAREEAALVSLEFLIGSHRWEKLDLEGGLRSEFRKEMAVRCKSLEAFMVETGSRLL